MIRIIAALLFSLVIGGAQAQVLSGGGPMVPNAPPGVQVNLSASVDPTINNDQTQGYQVGSLWQNAATGRVFIARAVSAGAAVWTNLELADHPGYIVGNWYYPPQVLGLSTGVAPGAGSIRLYPGYIKQRTTLNSLGLRINTLSVGGNTQAAIYAANVATGRPTGTALASTASMSTTSAGNVNSAVSIQLEPGVYWWATNCDNGTAIFESVLNTSPAMSFLVGSAAQNNLQASSAVTGLAVTQTFGTWPDLTSASFTELVSSSTLPIVQFKIGSVP